MSWDIEVSIDNGCSAVVYTPLETVLLKFNVALQHKIKIVRS